MIVVVVLTIRFYQLGVQSQQEVVQSLIGGELSPCPKTPNCVSSEYKQDAEHYVEPIKFLTPTTLPSVEMLIQQVQAMGGEVVEHNSGYIAAIFKSNIFQFVDDFELRIDRANAVIHIRSASRVGYGDLGVNKKRVSEFKQRLKKSLSL